MNILSEIFSGWFNGKPSLKDENLKKYKEWVDKERPYLKHFSSVTIIERLADEKMTVLLFPKYKDSFIPEQSDSNAIEDELNEISPQNIKFRLIWLNTPDVLCIKEPKNAEERATDATV